MRYDKSRNVSHFATSGRIGMTRSKTLQTQSCGMASQSMPATSWLPAIRKAGLAASLGKEVNISVSEGEDAVDVEDQHQTAVETMHAERKILPGWIEGGGIRFKGLIPQAQDVTHGIDDQAVELALVFDYD